MDMPRQFLLKLPPMIITSVIPDDAPDPLAEFVAVQHGKAVLIFPKDEQLK